MQVFQELMEIKVWSQRTNESKNLNSHRAVSNLSEPRLHPIKVESTMKFGVPRCFSQRFSLSSCHPRRNVSRLGHLGGAGI